MKIKQIVSETATTAGSVATVAQPLGEMEKRSPVRGLEPAEKVMKGTAKKKGPYANSISEGKKRIKEADLSEEDLILGPGIGRKLKSGFIKHDPDRAEHEGETLKNSLHTIIRVAKALDRELSTRDNFPEWVSEKIGATKGMIVAVADYLISSQEMQHDPDAMEGMTGAGVIAGGAQYENVENNQEELEKNLRYSRSRSPAADAIRKKLNPNRAPKNEGAKVDRMVKHIEKSEEKAGKSKEEAENIAWATANKRGMLDNKNKKQRADEGIMDVIKNKFAKKPKLSGRVAWNDPQEMDPAVQSQLKQQRLQKLAAAGQNAQDQMATSQPASSVAASNAFGNMVSQLAPNKPAFKPTRTGSVAQTSTGLIHAPKANNPNVQAQKATQTQQAGTSGQTATPAPAPAKQKLDPNRIMNGIMTLNDKEFKQVVDFMRNQIRKGRGA
jgi:hypothetical protein